MDPEPHAHDEDPYLDDDFPGETRERLEEMYRQAEASYRSFSPRFRSEVLKALHEVGLVEVLREPTHAIYRLNEKHGLAEPLRHLFAEERACGIDPQPVIPERWSDPWLLR